MNYLKSSLSLVWNTYFQCTTLINDEKTKIQPSICFEHTFSKVSCAVISLFLKLDYTAFEQSVLLKRVYVLMINHSNYH